MVLAVSVSAENVVTVTGPKGELELRQVDPEITVSSGMMGFLRVERPTEQKRHKALHGLYQFARQQHG